MPNATRYKETVCWRTLCIDVYLLTEDVGDTPATFRLSVKAIDGNDSGALLAILTGYFLIDNIGTPYRIIAVGSGTIDVSDDFMTYQCPTVGMDGFICKSVWKGRAPYLTTEQLQFLHPLATSNINKYNLDILWSNDPNAIRIPFTNTQTPSITGYQANYAEDYGEDPQIELFTMDSANVYWDRQEKPIRNYIGGLLDSIVFDLSDLYSGYIKISK